MIRFLVIFLFLVAVLHMAPLSALDVGDARVGPFTPAHLFHVAMFIPWGAFGLCYVYRLPGGRLRRGLAWIALGFAAAAMLEGTQYWIGYRSFSLVDMALNFAGVLAGSSVLIILRPKGDLKTRRRSRRDVAEAFWNDRRENAGAARRH